MQTAAASWGFLPVLCSRQGEEVGHTASHLLQDGFYSRAQGPILLSRKTVVNTTLITVGMEASSSWEPFNSIREKAAKKHVPKLLSRHFWNTGFIRVNDKNLISFSQVRILCVVLILRSSPSPRRSIFFPYWAGLGGISKAVAFNNVLLLYPSNFILVPRFGFPNDR